MIRAVLSQACRIAPVALLAAGLLAAAPSLAETARKGPSVTPEDATPAAGFDPATCYQSFEGATPIKYEKLAEPPYSLALSNSYIGNVWRTQMINMANVFVTRPDIAPLISDWQVSSSGEDIAAQISQMENMISSGAQAIIVNAISPTALSPTVQRARQEGIVVDPRGHRAHQVGDRHAVRQRGRDHRAGAHPHVHVGVGEVESADRLLEGPEGADLVHGARRSPAGQGDPDAGCPVRAVPPAERGHGVTRPAPLPARPGPGVRRSARPRGSAPPPDG